MTKRSLLSRCPSYLGISDTLTVPAQRSLQVSNDLCAETVLVGTEHYMERSTYSENHPKLSHYFNNKRTVINLIYRVCMYVCVKQNAFTPFMEMSRVFPHCADSRCRAG